MLAGEDDFRDVISAVTDLIGRWKDLGVSLGVCPSDFDTILSNNALSSSDCLIKGDALTVAETELQCMYH